MIGPAGQTFRSSIMGQYGSAVMRLAIAATILFYATSASAEQVLRYSVVFSGKTNGTQTTTVADDGRIVVDYTYRNNGRGPDLREETVLADDGTQVSYSAKGKS